MNILSVKNISKRFTTGGTTVQALWSVSFDVKEGNIVAIMGSSGSGKSTLLNIIGGLDVMDAGHIYFDDQSMPIQFKEPDLTNYRRDNLGFIFQKFNLLKDLNVRDNIAIPALITGMRVEEINCRVDELSHMVGISDKLDSRPSHLSGGQQQRVAIARAMINMPKVLLADEPTGNLDYNTANDVIDVMLKMNEELKQTIILVTHNPQIAALANRVLFLQGGEVKAQHENVGSNGDVNEILELMKMLAQQGSSHDRH